MIPLPQTKRWTKPEATAAIAWHLSRGRTTNKQIARLMGISPQRVGQYRKAMQEQGELVPA